MFRVLVALHTFTNVDGLSPDEILKEKERNERLR